MDEIQEFRSTVRKLAESEIPKFLTESNSNLLPRPLFNSFASIGLAGLNIDPAYDGIRTSAETTTAILEEISRVALGPAIFVSVHGMVSGLIGGFGSEKQKKDLLPRLAKGELLGAFGLSEPQAGSDAVALRTSAKKEGDNYVINGEKCYISSAGFADLYLVFARTGSGNKGISAFIVESTRDGIDISAPDKKMGCDLSPIASMRFSNVSVPAANLVGAEGEGYKMALSGLSGGRINISACANGISRKAIEIAVNHLKNRSQFGHALIEFQGLQFMLADMQIKLEAAKLLTARAAAALDSKDLSRSILLSSAAKCFGSDSAMSITTDAVQLLGGAGYIRDYTVERLMRDAKMLQIVEGTNQIQRIVIAREMQRDGFNP